MLSISRTAATVGALALTATASIAVAGPAQAATANCSARYGTSSGEVVANFHVDVDRRSQTTWRAYVTPTFYSTSSKYSIAPTSIEIFKPGGASTFGWSGDRWERQNKLFSSAGPGYVVVNVKFTNKATGSKVWKPCSVGF